MIRLKTIASTILLSLFSISYAGAKPSTPLKSKFFKEVTYDFGKIDKNKTVSHDFNIMNTSGKTLHIYKAEATCGCIVVKSPSVLKPQESGCVTVTYNYNEASGRFYKNVFLMTSDKTESLIKLKVWVEIN